MAGCDRLTIAPSLLEELENSKESVFRVLDPKTASGKYENEKMSVDEKSFRYHLNMDAMATEKLSEGIRGFCADIEKLEKIITNKIEERMTLKDI